MTMTSQFYQDGLSMPGALWGVDDNMNLQVPLPIIQTYILNTFNATTGVVNAGNVVFYGNWITNTTYYPNAVVAYSSNAYLLKGTDGYLSISTPDFDPDHWLRIKGNMLVAEDLNDMKTNMSFFLSTGAANAPAAFPNGYGMVFSKDASTVLQIFFSSDGTQIWARQMNSGIWLKWYLMAENFPIATEVLIVGGVASINVAAAKEFYAQVSSNLTVSFTGWPALIGLQVIKVRLELVNPGAHTVTWGSTITWIKSDGTLTNDLSDLGITLNANGSNFFEFWSYDDGNTIFGTPYL